MFFTASWQWLTSSPRYRGALLCGLSVVGAMIAIAFNGSKGFLAPSPPLTQPSDVVAARISAMSAGLGTSNPATSIADNGIGDAKMAEASPVDNDARTGKGGPSARAIALDKSFLAADTEKRKAAIQAKDGVKKTANKPKKKTQRRVSSERDRQFNPSREIKRAGEGITRVIREIF